MAFDTVNLAEITEGRQKSLAQSIRTISLEELKALGDRLFPFVDHPWRDKFFAFLTENAGATFYHAIAHDGVQVVYCPTKDKGIWFMPGVGNGPMQEKGRAIMKKIVEGQ